MASFQKGREAPFETACFCLQPPCTACGVSCLNGSALGVSWGVGGLEGRGRG